MHNFRKLDVWKLGVEYAIEVYALTKMFPKEELFGLSSQIRRAASSIPANIAEGSATATDKAFTHYLRIALGSAFELETLILIAKSQSYITEETYLAITEKIVALQVKLSKLVNKFSPTVI